MTTVLTAGGYAADLAALTRRRIEHEASADPRSPTATTETLTLRHREAMLAGGRPEDLLALGAEVGRAVDRFPAWPDLRLLRATVALALHQPRVARTALAAVPGLTELPAGRVLAADLAQFCGDYRAAADGYRTAADEDPAWDTTARLGALAGATGRFEEADDRYAAAEDEITVKQMRSFAWVRVQRGDLALALGDHDRAGRFFADAGAAYGGWWYVAARGAALAAGLGQHAEAAAGYRRVVAEVDRPEFREALGTALAAAGEPDAAAGCHAAALAAYTRSATRGEVHYLHHLAAFYADVRPHARTALAWAQQDAALRRSGATLSLLAWCQYRAGWTAEARATLDEAFARGAGDPLLQARAQVIHGGTR